MLTQEEAMEQQMQRLSVYRCLGTAHHLHGVMILVQLRTGSYQ